MTYKWLITILIFLSIILGFIFVQYTWIPRKVIKACYLWSLDRAKSVRGNTADLDIFYVRCLRENGIDKDFKY
jgi:hypothetical protein